MKKPLLTNHPLDLRAFLIQAALGGVCLFGVFPALQAAETVQADPGEFQAGPPLAQAGTPVQALPQPVYYPQGPQAAWPYPAYSLRSQMEQQLAAALVKTAGKAGNLAKTVGQGISEYVRERQMERTQQELVQGFYMHLESALEAYLIEDSATYHEITAEVERIYIEDGSTDEIGLDTLTFREMPDVVRHVYGDILLRRAQNGAVTTYYMNGTPKTDWTLRGGQPHGSVTTYYPDGEILYIDIYEEGRRMSRRKYDQEGRLEFEQDYRYEKEPRSEPEAPQPAVSIIPIEPIPGEEDMLEVV